MPGFKLVSLILKDSPEYDAGSYQFLTAKTSNKRTAQLTTLIIGPNGTGKSRLLKIIIDIFNDLYNLKTDGNDNFKFNQYYFLTYQLNESEYTVENLKGSLKLEKKGQEIKNIRQLPLPAKGIVAAFSLHERFTPKKAFSNKNAYRHKTRYDNDFYEYLGIKTERNYTFSGSNINKSIDLITEALADEGFQKDLVHVFELLDLNPFLVIEYKAQKNKDLFRKLIEQPEDLIHIINNISHQNSFSFGMLTKIRDGDKHFLQIVADSINDVKEFMNDRLSYHIELTFDKSRNIEFRQRYKSLSLLKSLGLLNYGEIIVFKKNNRPSVLADQLLLRHMSSGEIHILTSMLSLSAVVQNNSLVIIDEPEISLHPNWQIRFVEIINNIFKMYKDCHFIIASHSHFLVSDLNPDSSSILVLNKDEDNKIVPELLDFDTYGWSAENVLYNVFGVATSRNHYFEMELRRMLKIISSNSTSASDKVTVRRTVEKLSKFNITKDDPLSLLLNEAKKYAAKYQ
ncbi:AAA family ATPase [Desertivirga xinjiangensis]|uniref:AAA family ATPase n=1 Tax=Desertivirga xinjiangensis TaxID=539206 RepID=UPI00210DC8E1|nr:AAA family ATPase [Pedobacter xinjiangensis]